MSHLFLVDISNTLTNAQEELEESGRVVLRVFVQSVLERTILEMSLSCCPSSAERYFKVWKDQPDRAGDVCSRMMLDLFVIEQRD